MVRIVRHKALTVEGLRSRLKDVLGKPQQRECPTCHGTGQVNRPLSAAEVQSALEITPSQWSAFVNKGKTVTLETGLRILAWLDAMERDKLDELDDEHEPRDPHETDTERARARAVRAVSARAAAAAAIDARERPLQLVKPS